MPYHDFDETYSTGLFHRVDVYSHDLEYRESVHTRPMLDEDGEPCVGIYCQYESKLIARISLSQIGPDDDDNPNECRYKPLFHLEDQAAFESYVQCRERFRSKVSFEMWISCLPNVPICHWFEDHDDDIFLNPDTWKDLLMANMPCAESIVRKDLMRDGMKTKEIRALVNALGLKPKSIKREDCYAAILEARKEFEAEDAVCICPDPHDPDNKQRIAVVASNPGLLAVDSQRYFIGSDEKCTAYKVEQVVEQNMKPLAPINCGHANYMFAKSAPAHLARAGETQITKMTGAGMDLGHVSLALHVTQQSCWFANQQSTVLRDEITALQKKMDDSDKKREQLLATIQASTPVVLPDAEGKVTVQGKEFPFFNSPDAPLGIDNYSLEYWTASMRVGPGAAEVTFKAKDFMLSLLHDPVVSLVGAPGTGKTTICRQSAYVLGIPCFIVQFTRDKPIEQLIGVDKIRGGEQVFVDGEITVALRRAAASPDVPHVVVFDEFDHAPSEVQSDFHGVVEGRDYTLPNGETIENHGNLRFVLTRNTTGHGDQSGRHASANVSDSAFNSRVRSAFMVDYMDSMHEQVLLTVHGLNTDEAEQMVAFANATRQSVKSLDSGESFDGMSEPVCLRHLIGYAQARSRGVFKSEALAMSILAHLPESDRSVANEMIVSHIEI